MKLKNLENIAKESTVQEIGKNLYYIKPEGVVCNEVFLNALFKEILFNIKEYNTDTSAQHPTSEGDDIVRAYTKDKYKNQEIKNS